jgi:hypothetical protein
MALQISGPEIGARDSNSEDCIRGGEVRRTMLLHAD